MGYKELFDLLPGGIKVIKYVYDNRHGISGRYRAMIRRFFYKEKIVDSLIFNFNGNRIKDDEFINYKTVFDGNIYPSLGMEIKVQRSHSKAKRFRLPYIECINFIDRPNAKLCLMHTGEIPQIYPDNDICRETKKNLDEYLKQRPDTYNEPILCMKRLEETAPDSFVCEVGWTHFTEVVRTNLTLDYPLQGHFRESLRHRETALANEGLPSLQDSKLMNFIGVSAIWCMDKGIGAPSERYYYYLKCRQKKLSVYYNMLGTPSGYVNPPEPKRFDNPDLMGFMRSEILREFDEETGFEKYAKAHGYSIFDETGKGRIEVIPLALTRELVRGGIPQLFFLIITPYITDHEFVNYFKSSRDGEKEFRDDMAGNRFNHPLSPETLTNLLYAYKWMQRSYRNDGFIKV